MTLFVAGVLAGLVCGVGQYLSVPVGSLCHCNSFAICHLHWMLLHQVKGQSKLHRIFFFIGVNYRVSAQCGRMLYMALFNNAIKKNACE